MPGITITDILAQVVGAKDVLKTGTSQVEGFLADAAAVSKGSVRLLETAAEDAALIDQAKTAAELSTQTARQQLGIDFGTDRTAQNQIYTMLAEKARTSYETMDASQQVIKEKESKSLLEDPIGYITSRLTINQDIRKYNAAERERDGAIEHINKLNQATLGSATLQQQFANVVTTASAEASARQAAVAWKFKANEATLEGIKYNIEGVKTVLAASAQNLQFTFSAKQAQNAEEQLALSRRASARADEEWAFRKEAKLKEDKYDSSILDSINVGRAIRGLPPLAGVKADTALQTIRAKGPAAEEFLADWKAGEFAEATGKFQLGQTAAEVASRLRSNSPINVSPPQELVKTKINQAIDFVTSSKTFDPKDVTGNTAKLNAAVVGVLTQDAREVRPSDAKNIFSIAPIADIVKASPAAAATPVYTKVLKPLLDTGVDLNDPSKVMAAVIDGVKTGKLTYNDVISLTTIYQVGSAANLAQRDLPKFGIPAIGKFYTYNVRLDGQNGSSDIVDVTKPDILGRWINKQLSYRAFRDIGARPADPFERFASPSTTGRF